MPRKRYTTEQIIGKLREAEVELSRGKTVGQVCKQLGVTEQTYYRWRKEYGGLRVNQAKRFRDLERENARLKKLIADMALDNDILREAASGNFRARRSDVKRLRMYGGNWAKFLYRNVVPALCSARRAQRSEEEPMFATTSRYWSSA